MDLFQKIKVRPIQFIILATLAFIISMVIFPSEVFEASKTGIAAWWNIVFPALLPFFISSELLMGYGVVRFMGVLLEPVMRPLFNLPGAASFVMAVGYTSGFPISASLSARLRKDRLCTRYEAERIMCFSNNASPLFMLVAVGVGMFGNPRLGVIIALSHYAANLIIGFILRFYKTKDPEYVPGPPQNGNLFNRAFLEMKKSYRSNPRPFGKMLGDAITSSMDKLMVIGGFVIIFSVIIRVSALTGIMNLITHSLGFFMIPLGFTESIVNSLSSGFFEITLGTKAASAAAAPLAQKIIASSIILGWSGVSVLAQVAAMINDTDLKLGLFTLSRFLQSVFGGIFCFFALNFGPVINWLAKPVSTGLTPHLGYYFLPNLIFFTRLCIYTILGWVLTGIAVYVVRSFSIIRLKIR